MAVTLGTDAAEASLLARLRAGSDEAFETLVRTTSPRLLAVARRIVGDDDAPDTLQDAYLAAFRNLGSFQGEARLSTWLHRIVVNTALMRLRTRKRRREEAIEPLLPSFLEDGHQTQQPVEWRDDVEVQLSSAETQAYLRARIDQLPETYRNVLLLRDIEELSTHEAAHALGISENAVKIRLHRARQALRALIDARFRPPAATAERSRP